MVRVMRTHHALGKREGLTTLEQRFLFVGDGAGASAIGDLLMTAPLTGDGSIFGARPGEPGVDSEGSRSVRRFSPAPGFRFDVLLTRRSDTVFVVQFSQLARDTPYLEGAFTWTISDEAEGTALDEQINTERALEAVDEPLSGPGPSLRRWLFFRVGHPQVMRGATANIAALLETQSG